MNRALIAILSLICFSAAFDMSWSAPPVKKRSAKTIELQLGVDSLSDKIKLRHSSRIDSLIGAIDSTVLQSFGELESLKQSTFREIIIDEDGTIKVYSDTGLITIIGSDLDTILPKSWKDTKSSGQEGVVSWGKNVTIDENMQIESDVQTFSGNVTVKGTVAGDVQVVGGDIYVSSSGRIRGNAVAIGGRIKVEDGGRIDGLRIQTHIPMGGLKQRSAQQIAQGVLLIIVLLGLLLSVLAVALFPAPVISISDSLCKDVMKSFFVGYAGYFIIFIVWILLLVSVIGIPLALLGQPIGFMIITVLAHAATTYAIGRKMVSGTTALGYFFYGSLLTTLPIILLLLIGYFTDSIALMVINFVLLGVFIFLFLPFGLGAALLLWLGKKGKAKEERRSSQSQSVSPTT